MALRVLLADESPTIKKVFQLALQDYAADVRSVNVGVDVSSVAQEFQPDVIFADVLLQKRNGYEVSAELKASNELKQVPIVLMWSQFMNFDESKFESCGADAKIEKPFDVNTLRGLVQKLVPKTQSQDLSQYLQFPSLPDIEDDDPSKAHQQSQQQESQPQTPPQTQHPSQNQHEFQQQPAPNPEVSSKWDMESFEPIENFSEASLQGPSSPLDASTSQSPSQNIENESEFYAVDLTPQQSSPESPTQKPQEEEPSEWVQKDIDKFQVDSHLINNDVPDVNYVVPETPIEDNFLEKDKIPQTPFEEPDFSQTNSISSSTQNQESRSQQENSKKTNAPPQPTPDEPHDISDLDPSEELELEFEEPELEPQAETASSQKSKRSQELGSTEALSRQELEHIVRKQCREVIEDVVWKVVPDLAAQMIEKELQKLLKEQEQSDEP